MSGGEFYRASTVQEALDLLAKFGAKAHVLAGGTDIMVKVNRRQLAPEVLVYIGECGLNYIKDVGDKVVIGGATPFADILRSDVVRQKLPLLAEAVARIGTPAIRNVGTIGGNLVTASPAADSSVPLLALGASVKLASKSGERVVPLESFFTGPGQTVRRPDELLVEVIVPVPDKDVKFAYHKIGRRKAGTLSVVAGAVVFKAEGAMPRGTAIARDQACYFEKCTQARVVLNAVAPTPLLAKKASALLEGSALDAELITKIAKTAAEETSPIDDVRASAWYRRQASEGLVKSLLERIVA